jgi:hypothetical protein
VTVIDGPGTKQTIGRNGAGRRAWVRVALRLFPTSWLERYGVEFGALLDDTRTTPSVLFDVLVAAVDAHVHPTGPRRRWPLMNERLRLSELVVFSSWVVFVVAGLAFQRMTEGPPFAVIAAGQPAVGWTYLAIVAGSVVSLCAVIFASLPILLAIARMSIAARQWRQVALLAVPPAALAIWVAFTALLVAIGDPPADGMTRVILFVVWVGTFVLAAVASTVAVSAAALNAEVDGALYRRAARPAMLTAIAMAVVVLAVVAWGVAVAVVSPADFWSFDGLLSSSTPLTWLVIVIVMAGAAWVALRAALRARGATNPPTA